MKKTTFIAAIMAATLFTSASANAQVLSSSLPDSLEPIPLYDCELKADPQRSKGSDFIEIVAELTWPQGYRITPIGAADSYDLSVLDELVNSYITWGMCTPSRCSVGVRVSSGFVVDYVYDAEHLKLYEAPFIVPCK